MIPLPFLKHHTVGVLGLGKSGLATARALVASGARVIAWDDNEEAMTVFIEQMEAAGMADGALLRAPGEWPWERVKLVVLSPGLPYTHPVPHPGVRLAQQHGVEIVGDVELLYRAQPQATYIAITGTNGKSTTTSLIGHIMQEAGRRAAVGGNLGTPALALAPLETLSQQAGEGENEPVYVLELSSYQLDLVRTTRFSIAVLLNFSPDHLDRHGDMAGYIAAKRHIFDRQRFTDYAVIGVDDSYSEALARQLIAGATQRIVPIMTTQQSRQGIWVKDGMLYEPEGVFSTHEASPEPATIPLAGGGLGWGIDLSPMTGLQGLHNHQNAAAAYATCRAAGLSPGEIDAGMNSYAGLEHRMQRVGRIGRTLFVNDSKATNADAAARSLATYQSIYWIAGGVAKEGGIESLAPFFPRIAHAYLIGEAQEAFASTLEGHVAYTRSGTLEQAVRDAAQQAKADNAAEPVVLLAPACAAFDQFANFEKRGERFAELVQTALTDSESEAGAKHA